MTKKSSPAFTRDDALPAVPEDRVNNSGETSCNLPELSCDLSELNLNGRARKESSYSDDLSCYTVPKRTEAHDELLQKYCQMFSVSINQMRETANAFTDELKKGLNSHLAHPNRWVESECCFKMLDSCVTTVPTGKEKGVFYALDFGGTNLRAVRVVLEGDGKVDTSQACFSLKYDGPSGSHKGLLDGTSTADMLFDHFANRIKDVMERSGDSESAKKNPIGVGFTFSFPCEQQTLTESYLMEWTKGFETGRKTDRPVEKRDVGRLLSEAFVRQQVHCTLSAIANDTVGTLLSCAYQTPPEYPACCVGVIIGTGMNGCYIEPKSDLYGYKGKIINIECGNFNSALPLTEVDSQVDWETSNRGRQLLEKLVSGAYLGEIMRLTVIRVFRNRAPIRSWTTETFTTEDGSVVANDNTPDLSIAFERIKQKWHASLTTIDLIDVQRIVRTVFDRSAALTAAAICAMCKQTGQLGEKSDGVTVAIDGSLYVKNKWYANRIRSNINLITGQKVASKIFLLPAHDGSGQGAAILAATCVKHH